MAGEARLSRAEKYTARVGTQGSLIGSATQVMLVIQVRATVGQKHYRPEGDQRQPWSSETHAQGVDQYSSKRTAIFTAASRITSARPADTRVWPAPKTVSLLTNSAR